MLVEKQGQNPKYCDTLSNGKQPGCRPVYGVLLCNSLVVMSTFCFGDYNRHSGCVSLFYCVMYVDVNTLR